ncbi:MAG: hypothetical protein OXF88_07665 [Rhodobacteraceae bacterium]|nr:hypothetical protein [Paracoccaceae bacterium]
METNGYLHITADTHSEAGKAADRFIAKAGLTTEYSAIDYDFALGIGAEITDDTSSAKIEIGLDSGPFSANLSADTKGQKSIMIGVKFKF